MIDRILHRIIALLLQAHPFQGKRDERDNPLEPITMTVTVKE